MKKIIAIILFVFGATNAFAAGSWYTIDKYSGKCKVDAGPADLIKTLQELKKLGKSVEYKTNDVKVENGKPVIVRITIDDGVQTAEAMYYRSKELCKADTNAAKKKDSAELDRYK